MEYISQRFINKTIEKILPKIGYNNEDSNTIIMLDNNNELYLTCKENRDIKYPPKFIDASCGGYFNWEIIDNDRTRIIILGKYEIYIITKSLQLFYIGLAGGDVYYIHYDAMDYLLKYIRNEVIEYNSKRRYCIIS